MLITLCVCFLGGNECESQITMAGLRYSFFWWGVLHELKFFSSFRGGG